MIIFGARLGRGGGLNVKRYLISHIFFKSGKILNAEWGIKFQILNIFSIINSLEILYLKYARITVFYNFLDFPA